MRNLRQLDAFIIVPVLYLLTLGVIIQYAIINKTTGLEIDLNIQTHIGALGIGLVIALLLSQANMMRFFKRAFWLYVFAIGLLIAVQLFGVEVNGSQRWIALGSIQIQPTEIAKLSLVLFLARLFDTREATVNRLGTVIQSLLMTVLPAVLILLQPDLGSAVVLFVIWISVLFVSRLKLSRFSLLIIAMLAGVLVLTPFLAEYQQERLVSYFNPEKDATGSNYNVLQAGIAIGSGGITGVGLDAGTQSQLNFLPSQHTDFVFAVVGEKLGLLGAMSVIVAVALLFMRISYLAWVTENQLERGVLTGIATVIFFHAFVNIGMNLGLVPVTGLPLPFLSYGGTFMVIMLSMVGICLSVSSSIRMRQRPSNRLVV